MLFNLSRVILWLVISALAIFKIRTSKIVRKKLISILTVVLCMALLSISAMFPVENLFINFKSPQSVFNYANFGKIDEIIYGQDSCMVIYAKGNSTGGHYIIPKTEKGYKIPSYFATKKIYHKFDENALFDVYNIKNTQDYYVFGVVHLKETDNQLDIFDGEDKKIDSNIVRVENTDFIYFYLHSFSDEYYLLINGNKVSISK